MNILLISNEPGAESSISTLLEPQYLPLTNAATVTEAIHYLAQDPVDAILFSFNDVNEAHTIRLELKNRQERESLFDPLTILLCHSAVTQKAYNLCLAGVFDYYVVTKPAYDSYALNAVLHRMLGLHQRSQTSEVQNKHIMFKVYQQLTEMLQSMEKMISHNLEQQKAIPEEVKQTVLALQTNLSALLQPVPSLYDLNQLNLPQASLTPPVETMAQKFWQELEYLNKLLKIEQNNTQNSLYQLEQAGADKEHSKALIVKDNPVDAMILQTLLEQIGFRVESVSSFKAALKILSRYVPSVIFLDQELPDSSGLDLLYQIK